MHSHWGAWGSQQSSLISVFPFPVQSPSSTTPPIEICSSRLTKLMRRTTDKKSEFLKALKDDRNGEITENRECDKLDDVSSLHLRCIWLLLKELGLKKPWAVYVIQAVEEEGNDSHWSGTCASGNSAQQWWREMCSTMKCKWIRINEVEGKVTDVDGNLDYLKRFSKERNSIIF